jgi:hypothetical protein
VSSESSESLSRPALVGSAGLMVSGGGEGDGDGELRESRDIVEPDIVVDGEEDGLVTVADNKRIVEGTCARIPQQIRFFLNRSLSYLISHKFNLSSSAWKSYPLAPRLAVEDNGLSCDNRGRQTEHEAHQLRLTIHHLWRTNHRSLNYVSGISGPISYNSIDLSCQSLC